MAKVWQDGAAGNLWHLYLKINTDFGSLTQKLHLIGAALADVKAKAIAIATRLRWCMPTGAEIHHAHLSRDDSDQDSRQLPGAIGPGLFGSNKVGGALVTKFNRYTDVLLVACEDETGGSVTRKFGPLPDEVVVQQEMKTAVVAVSGDALVTAPVTAAGIVYEADVSWFAEMHNLMQEVAADCVNVKSGHPPGGAFKYARIYNMLPGLVGGKKGGRVINSPRG